MNKGWQELLVQQAFRVVCLQHNTDDRFKKMYYQATRWHRRKVMCKWNNMPDSECVAAAYLLDFLVMGDAIHLPPGSKNFGCDDWHRGYGGLREKSEDGQDFFQAMQSYGDHPTVWAYNILNQVDQAQMAAR